MDGGADATLVGRGIVRVVGGGEAGSGWGAVRADGGDGGVAAATRKGTVVRAKPCAARVVR